MKPIGLLTGDRRLLLACRCLRMIAYGLSSIVLVLHLVELGVCDSKFERTTLVRYRADR